MTTFDSNKRLVSLDMLRGLTIALMIVVNDPGSWEHIFRPLKHADWHGITITDCVFPFFLFIAGVSLVLSTHKQLATGADKKMMRKKVRARSIRIFALGLLLNLFPEFNFAELRIPGVLQRIAIVYLVSALIFLSTDWKAQLKIAVALLAGYWLAMMLIPVPGLGAGVLEPGKNLAAWIDSMLMPGKMWQGTWDPEGILSTVPAIATGISGMLAGQLLKQDMGIERKLNYLFLAGLLCVIGGYIWDPFFPINKNLWTSSYVLFTSGWAIMGLAACLLLVDVLGHDQWAKFGVIYGSNAITVYVFAGMFPWLMNDIIGFKDFFYNGLVGLGMMPELASLLYAIVYALVCFIPAYMLHKRKIFIRI